MVFSGCDHIHIYTQRQFYRTGLERNIHFQLISPELPFPIPPPGEKLIRIRRHERVRGSNRDLLHLRILPQKRSVSLEKLLRPERLVDRGQIGHDIQVDWLGEERYSSLLLFDGV